MPSLHWPAVGAGILVSAAVAVTTGALIGPMTAVAASFFGLAVGGFLAGKLANSAGAYHGAVVGAGFILLEALGLIPTPSYAGDAFADTVAVIVLDAAVLVSATLGGALSSRVASSSGRGRDR